MVSLVPERQSLPGPVEKTALQQTRLSWLAELNTVAFYETGSLKNETP